MIEAGITNLPASPKGLRHAFGVHAVFSGIPLDLIQKWLGHEDIETTAIYTNVLGAEERQVAARMW
jgi:site-specific recombinase XerD